MAAGQLERCITFGLAVRGGKKMHHNAPTPDTLPVMCTARPIPSARVMLVVWDGTGLGAKALNRLCFVSAQVQWMSREWVTTGKSTLSQSPLGCMHPPTRASLMAGAFVRSTSSTQSMLRIA